MAANQAPIFIVAPRIGSAKLATTSAQVKSDGTCAASTPDLMYCVFKAGANGSLVQRVRFNSVASAANTTGVATTLRIYKTTVGSQVEGSASGATTAANTFLIGEISVPAIATSHSTTQTPFFEIILNTGMASGDSLLVSQHVAQTTNQQWQAQAFGGDY